jgi:hypothetical protein
MKYDKQYHNSLVCLFVDAVNVVNMVVIVVIVVEYIQLSPSARARYNVTAALKWFQSVEGLPYGYHNFIFGYNSHIKRKL